MAEIYKLIFDLAVYYTLTGFYINALFREEVSGLGLLLLCLVAVLEAVLRMKGMELKWRKFTLLLPAVALAVWPGFTSAIHFLIAWVYLSYVILSERTGVDYKGFRHRFTQSCYLLLLLLPGFAFCDGAAEAFASILIYLLLQLVSGICCLRTLREAKQDNGRQAMIVLAITAGCGLLTLLGVPQMLTYLLKNYVWDILMQGLSLLAMVLAYGIIWLLEWLVSLGEMPEREQGGGEGASTAEILGIEEELLKSDTGDILWLEIFGYIFLSLLILTALVLLIRFLLGSRGESKQTAASVWAEERERIVSRRRRSRRKPQEPRAAVRYYYAMYMRECRRRGIALAPSQTCQELTNASCEVFSHQDPSQLSEAYESARYCMRQPVTNQQAKRAGKLWQSLKKSKV